MLSFDCPRFVLPAVERAMKLRHGRLPRRRELAKPPMVPARDPRR